MREENTMEQHDSTEAPLCDACRRIPISHLALDVDEPVQGWEPFFAERYITVMDDSLGRPSVARHVLGGLIAEQREHEARLAEEAAAKAATLKEPVPFGVRALEGMSAFETMMSVAGTSPQEEFGRIPPPSFLEEALEEGQRHQAAEGEAARRRKEKAK
jgi:hypothetical protein